MPTIIESAILSSHVYQDSLEGLHGLSIREVTAAQFSKASWKASDSISWYHAADVATYMTPAHPCYCALYLKFKDNKLIDAVMAIRGTRFNHGEDDWQDIEAWCSDALGEGEHDIVPSYFGTVLSFYGNVLNYLKAHFPYYSSFNVVFTGHSLGGALAKLFCLRGHLNRVASFNAPGCGHFSDIEPEYATVITNVNSRWGWVNKIGETLPHEKTFYVDIPEHEQAAEQFVKDYEKAHRSPNDVFQHVLHAVKQDITHSKVAEQARNACLKTADFPKDSLAEHLRCDYVQDATGLTIIEAQHSIDHLIRAIIQDGELAHRWV